ncbi:MAG: hypothetical protein AB1815_02315 [Bacillota bacterium]
MAEIKAEVLAAVKKAARDGRLTCTGARSLAEELKVEPREIGDACNALKIKIKACELGCF